jgi:hypothetical protein
VKVAGTIVRRDLGPGVFQLEAKDGKRYGLHGGPAEMRRDGLKVVVEGEVVTNTAGIGMTGDPVLQVASFTEV